MAAEDWPDLVTVADLEGQPGSPFSPAAVKSGVGKVRGAAGWHIAPVITETITLDHDGAGVVVLPSLRVTEVDSVRDVSGEVPVDLTGWRWSAAGLLSGSFPCGFRSVEVTFSHGYADCPDELLSVIATATTVNGPIRSQVTGPFQVAYADDNSGGSVSSILARYKLVNRP